jgi:hypothetical protein
MSGTRLLTLGPVDPFSIKRASKPALTWALSRGYFGDVSYMPRLFKDTRHMRGIYGTSCFYPGFRLPCGLKEKALTDELTCSLLDSVVLVGF